MRVITPRFLTEGDEVVVPTMVHNYRPERATAAVSIAGDGPRGRRRAAAPTSGARRAAPSGATTGAIAAQGAGNGHGHGHREDRERRRCRRTADPDPALRHSPRSRHERIGRRRRRSDDDRHHARRRRIPRRDRSRFAWRHRSPDRCSARSTSSPEYPYGCTEQTLSSFLPNLLVTRALTELKLAPTERLSALDRQVSAGLQRLYDYPARRWRLGMVEGRRQSSVHDGLCAVGPRRSAPRRRQGADTGRINNGARELAHLYARVSARRAGSEGLRGLRAAARRGSRGRRSTWFVEGTRRAYYATQSRAPSCGTCAAA